MPRRAAKTAAAPPPDPRRDLDAALAAGDLGRAADAALELGSRDRLPDNLHTGYDAIRTAFARYEAGDDDVARTALDAVGLGSPFLDWKLLVRGLIAYANRDDARALENWSRLKPERLPAKLAAPLRAVLDASYLATQTPAAQALLPAAGDKLVGGQLPRLREVQRAMGRGARLSVAFRHAEPVVSGLRQTNPATLARLANAFANAIVAGGEPEDVDRLRHLFGPPADDPSLDRLIALAQEQLGEWADANDSWRKFADGLAKNPAWPEADRKRARAIVWCRMGVNATANQPGTAMFGPPPSFRPPADECFRKAIELAPDLAGGHVCLFVLLVDRGQFAQARVVGEALLARFSDHVDTLRSMAEVCVALGDADAALGYARRAAEVNPLDRALRVGLATVHRIHARTADRVHARADLDAALALFDGAPTYGLLAQRWAVERAAKDPSADEYERQALAAAPHRLAAVLAFVAEGARYKVPKPARKPFDDELAAALKTPEPAGIAALVDASVDQATLGDYHGAKSHQKKILDAAKKSVAAGGEADLARLCEVLAAREQWKQLLDVAKAAKARYPKNAWFLLREAQVHIEQDGKYGRGPWKARPLLDRAKRLATDPAAQALLAELEAAFVEMTGFSAMDDIFDAFFGRRG